MRVRIGVHTGEALLSEEGYLGLAVHRAARICAAGHGGQVLLSHSTATVFEDDLVPGVTLDDLGEHRLKDLDRPERIHQAIGSEQPPDERLPKSLDAQPMKATPFAGQERELAAAAHAALSERRSLMARLRQALRQAPAGWQRATSLISEAVWETARAPKIALALAAVFVAAVVVSPWLFVAGAAVLVYHVVMTARTLRFFHGSEGVGWRVHSIGTIAPAGAFRHDLYNLAGALVRAGRVARDADVLVAQSDRRRLVRRLREIRATGLEPSLADAVARRLRTIDVLVDRRRALEDETRRLDADIASIRERSFDARVDGRVSDDLVSEVEGFTATISMLGASLADAYDDASRYASRAPGRRITRLLSRRMH